MVQSFLSDSPQGQQFAQLPAADVAQLLVLFDRLEHDPALKESFASLDSAPQLMDLAAQVGAPISLAASKIIAGGEELLDDDQLEQITGGSLTVAVIGLGAAVVALAGATMTWLASRNDLETAKINAGITSA